MFASIAAWDSALSYGVAAHRTPFLTDIFLFFTTLGNPFFVTVLSLSIAAVLWRHRRFAYKAGFAATLFGVLFAAELIKYAVARPRPPVALWLVPETGYSFPSMHAATSLAVYGFLAYMTWKLMQPAHHRFPWIVLLSTLVLGIGLSRIYLGVHYASDVAAGYALGALFLYIGIRTTRALSQGASKGAPSARRRHSRLA